MNEIVPNQQHLAIKSNNTTVEPISSKNSSQNLPVPKAYTSSASVSSDNSERFLHHHHHKGSSRTHHGYEGGYGGDNNGDYGLGYPFYGGGFFGRPY